MSTAAEKPTLRRLSSKTTYFYKRIFVVWWFGFSAFLFACMVFAKLQGQPVPSFALLMPIVLCAVGYWMFRELVWILVDQVWDAGDALVICNRGQKELLPLSAIRDVSWTKWQNPERITLMLYAPTQFGVYIHFLPTMRHFQFARHPVIGELLDRIAAAKQASVADDTNP